MKHLNAQQWAVVTAEVRLQVELVGRRFPRSEGECWKLCHQRARLAIALAERAWGQRRRLQYNDRPNWSDLEAEVAQMIHTRLEAFAKDDIPHPSAETEAVG